MGNTQSKWEQGTFVVIHHDGLYIYRYTFLMVQYTFIGWVWEASAAHLYEVHVWDTPWEYHFLHWIKMITMPPICLEAAVVLRLFSNGCKLPKYLVSIFNDFQCPLIFFKSYPKINRPFLQYAIVLERFSKTQLALECTPSTGMDRKHSSKGITF